MAGALAPVTRLAAPLAATVTTVLAPVTGVTAPVTTAVAGVLAPVTQLVVPLTGAAAAVLTPVTQLVAPLTGAADTVLGPLAGVTVPALDAVGGVLAPVTQLAAPVAAGVTAVLSGGGPTGPLGLRACWAYWACYYRDCPSRAVRRAWRATGRVRAVGSGPGRWFRAIAAVARQQGARLAGSRPRAARSPCWRPCGRARLGWRR